MPTTYRESVVIVLAGLVVALGALVQGTVGFGIALVSAPLLAILDPRLVPVPLLVLSGTHALLSLARERGDTDWRGVGWALVGRLPGTALGVLAVATLPQRKFAILIAGSVLVCAGLSALRWRLHPTPRTLMVAGLVGGVSGTASSIGGPPVALAYQRERGARIRSTMAAYFTAGTAMSVLSLAAAGQVRLDGLLTGALLLPFMFAGFLLSSPARRFLDRGWTRPAVVGLACTSALVLLAQALAP
nr:sulfite exporter TauE/SafE family protein [Pseudonocardia acidicola]